MQRTKQNMLSYILVAAVAAQSYGRGRSRHSNHRFHIASQRAYSLAYCHILLQLSPTANESYHILPSAIIFTSDVVIQDSTHVARFNNDETNSIFGFVSASTLRHDLQESSQFALQITSGINT